MPEYKFPFVEIGTWSKAVFGNNHPVILELGCGKGEYTLALGKAFAAKNFVGIDIKGDRIWKGATDALNQGLTNICFLRTQVEHINNFFGKNEVSGIWLTFPDPQEKKSRSKKRLTSPQFLEKYKQILKPGSPICLKTDNKPFFDYTLSVIHEKCHNLIEYSTDIYNDDHIDEPLLTKVQTYYESMYLKQGRPICYIKFSLNETRT